MEWSDPAPVKRFSKYRSLLEEIRENQHLNPDKWATMQWFERVASAREASSRLNGTYPDFEFRSQVDHETGMGVLYGRYTGS